MVELKRRRFSVKDYHRMVETGILTKNDPATLGDAVIGLLLDPERRRRMGHRAREIAAQEFDVRLQIERTLDVYAAAAERCRSRRSPPSP